MGQSKDARKQKAIRQFIHSHSLLACPICQKKMRMLPDGRCLCKKDHCFDLSQKGYLNLAGAGTLPGYDKTLFSNRRSVFAQGFFDPLLQELESIIAAHVNAGNPPCGILDAGCGEGFYLSRISASDALPDDCHCFGIDLSRDAIALAAQSDADVCWCVADLAKLPFKPETMDVILDILTPANYREFSRVLKPGGIIIKIIPGEAYLQEIRALLKDRLDGGYSSEPVKEYAKARLDISEVKPLTYRRDILPEQALPLLHMTPMTMHMDGLEQMAESLSSITVDLRILIGKKANPA